jgi:hypothetical protein
MGYGPASEGRRPRRLVGAGFAATVGGAVARGAAAIAIQAAIDIFLERTKRFLRFVRQPVRLMEPRQPLLKLRKYLAQVVRG